MLGNKYHSIEVVRNLQSFYTAYCVTCGWSGLAHGEKREAEDEGDVHVMSNIQAGD